MKAALLIIMLAGCASLPEGVTMSEDERKICAVETCGVYTPNELNSIAQHFFRFGVLTGQRRGSGI